ncbi:hypothetical protein [Rhodococcus sp. JVH1]|uniref:hypothetical protein n=1 Tax=Rhodococcus sp. JVH1 TaxID=745408 RepID=UPI000271F374|nr:hypothetical protein [Rhodococcus sp. JVH1]EJJ01653.1 hypothetical protein JVH1_0800 [Rhodococcus sp. JVH1]
MKTAELGVLKQIAVRELVAQSHRWCESDSAQIGLRHMDSGAEYQALGRLEDLGLIAFGAEGRSSSDVILTHAGVEALAYLAATA